MTKLASTKKLNIGSGEFKKEGFVNIDFFSISQPDVIHDLNKFPYPFSDNQFELVEADHILEHLDDPFSVMREIHRIAHDGAQVVIRVPHFSRGFSHPEHKRGFDITFPYYFKPDFRGGYQRVSFELKRMRLRWLSQPYLKKQVLPLPIYLLSRFFGSVTDIIANLSPALCSRFWCFFVGGFEEIEFVFEVRK